MKTVPERGAIGSLFLVLALAAISGSAYIDAGSGSYIFQLVVGAFVGVALAVKVFWRRISAFLGAKLSRKA